MCLCMSVSVSVSVPVPVPLSVLCQSTFRINIRARMTYPGAQSAGYSSCL